MAFVWAQDISAGTEVEKQDLDEVRTNIDAVVDNLAACFTHNATYETGLDTGYDADLKVTHCNGHDNGYDGTLHVTHKTSHRVGYYGTFNGTYKGTHKTSYRSSDKTNYK